MKSISNFRLLRGKGDQMCNLTKIFVLCLLSFVTISAALADVPPMINYQGKLLTPTGASVADTACVMQFAIYDAPTGGTLLWTETNNAVQVKKGLFSLLLGGISPLGPNIFNTPNRFLGVKVGADAEMTPRQQIVSSAFAFKAATADMAATAVNALMANTVPDGSITTTKIADGAVTASKIASSDWVAASYQNGWQDYAPQWQGARFYKDILGIVHIQGMVKNVGGDSTAVIFTLPVGYRPAKVLANSAIAATQGIVVPILLDVCPDGSVVPEGTISNWLGFSDVTFRADQ